jgi:hypothetical protein
MNPLRKIYEDAPAFIPVPAAFQHRRIEITIWPLEGVDTMSRPQNNRHAPPSLAGKARDLGDVINSVPNADWGMPE